jgi:UDP-N-acetylglucosamine 4,6-dehydratase
MSKILKNKVVLITGGTGSFGNTIANVFLDSDIKEVRIFSRDEKKQEEMRLAHTNSKLNFIIGDVRDYLSISSAMESVDFVFHAAALKQVPSCEFFPMEALKTNVLGSENVIQAAINHKVSKVVMLSTDKAVYPINAMGITKSLMEKVVVAKARQLKNSKTTLCITRYGNVMGSRGSVIPLFISQIKKNIPLTITNPDMTRFLMSLQDSVELVLHAFQFGEQGDTFIQKSDASTVLDLAAAISEIFEKKFTNKSIGTRHGEKLYETLVSREEMARAVETKKFFRIKMDNRDINYNSYFTEGNKQIETLDDYTSHNTNRLDIQSTKELLLTLDFVKKELHA